MWTIMEPYSPTMSLCWEEAHITHLISEVSVIAVNQAGNKRAYGCARVTEDATRGQQWQRLHWFNLICAPLSRGANDGFTSGPAV